MKLIRRKCRWCEIEYAGEVCPNCAMPANQEDSGEKEW